MTSMIGGSDLRENWIRADRLSREEIIVSQTSGLTVRQHEREGIAVPVEFAVNQAHGTQVRFSGTSSSIGSHVIRGEAIDISSGGMGLRTRQFVPRMCEGVVRVFAPSMKSLDGEDHAKLELMFEQKVKVRRITMIGREPTYSIGVAFTQPTPDLDQLIETLFARIQGGFDITQSPGRNASQQVKGAIHAKS